jgi:hypothetical protein
MKVENWINTKDCNCPPGKYEGSWIKRYGKEELGDKSKRVECSRVGCYAAATDGAHVRKEGEDKTYIIPLCNPCNKIRGEYIDVDDNTIFMSLIDCRCGESLINKELSSGYRPSDRVGYEKIGSRMDPLQLILIIILCILFSPFLLCFGALYLLGSLEKKE